MTTQMSHLQPQRLLQWLQQKQTKRCWGWVARLEWWHLRDEADSRLLPNNVCLSSRAHTLATSPDSLTCACRLSRLQCDRACVIKARIPSES